MSARTYSLVVVGEPTASKPREENANLHPAVGILTGIGLSLVFWVVLVAVLI